LLAAFDIKPKWPDEAPAWLLPKLEAAGLVIVTTEKWEGHLAFTDVGAIVYYLKAIPWVVPGFTVKTHLRLSVQPPRTAGSRRRVEVLCREVLD
jgi:hypothetical protein